MIRTYVFQKNLISGGDERVKTFHAFVGFRGGFNGRRKQKVDFLGGHSRPFCVQVDTPKHRITELPEFLHINLVFLDQLIQRWNLTARQHPWFSTFGIGWDGEPDGKAGVPPDANSNDQEAKQSEEGAWASLFEREILVPPNSIEIPALFVNPLYKEFVTEHTEDKSRDGDQRPQNSEINTVRTASLMVDSLYRIAIIYTGMLRACPIVLCLICTRKWEDRGKTKTVDTRSQPRAIRLRSRIRRRPPESFLINEIEPGAGRLRRAGRL